MLFINVHHTINTLLFFYTNWSFFSAIILYTHAPIHHICYIYSSLSAFLLKKIFYLSEPSQALYLVHKTMQQGFIIEAMTYSNNSSPILCYKCGTCSSRQRFDDCSVDSNQSLWKLIERSVWPCCAIFL